MSHAEHPLPSRRRQQVRNQTRSAAGAFAVILLVLAFLLAPAARAQEAAKTQHALFSRIDGMLASIRDITGLAVHKPVAHSFMSREEIRTLLERRMKEETNAEQIRLEELFLKKFGFVDHDFDLAAQTVEVLSEQAAALYDFKTKTLYLATWASEDLQEFSLIHELAHAVADQNFNLTKFVDKAKNSDEDLARLAVLEGQASWVMTEYVLRQGGRSMVDSRLLASAAAAASRIEAEDYPVYASAPLYIKESLLFPYTDGLLFQQEVVERLGRDGFATLFRSPPASTQQVLEPEAYFGKRRPAKPRLPKLRRQKGLRKVAQGHIGQLEHHILLEQYLGEEEADKLAPAWRGGRYLLLENAPRTKSALLYAVEWATASDAKRFFQGYLEICKRKWRSFEVDHEGENEVRGRSESGGFVIARDGTVVTSVEGVPE